MLFDLKCGGCGMTTTIDWEHYKERCFIDKEKPNYRRIVCQSCYAEIPTDFRNKVIELLEVNKRYDKWEIGLRFQRIDNLD